MSDGSGLPRVLSEPLRRRTWGELGYALLGLPIGIAGFVLAVATLSIGAGFLVTFVGLPMLALTGLLCRWLGGCQRRFANRMIGTDVKAPQAFRARPGLLGWLGSCLSDGTAWRARLYLVLKLPVGVLGFLVATFFWVYGLGGVTYWIWRPLLPCNTSSDGVCHRGVGLTRGIYADHVGSIIVFTLICVVLLIAAPWAVRAALSIDRLLVRVLLGPTSGAARVEQLERTRAAAVDDSAATLRRIERDLHDGAQARMVSVAMTVGLAREKLAEGADPATATRLLDTAHVTAKQAITELRDLARGIHPPVLDAGLDAALATLASYSAVPVRLDVALDDRPDPSIETMTYFCVAELLTNVAKHSGARQATIRARTGGGRLTLTVSDDGRGGAGVGTGTGLSGLADRVATVDGTLTVDSPAGGPTSARVDVPLYARSAR